MTYAKIEKLPAEAYLNPDLFRTVFDTESINAKSYARGLREGNSQDVITISSRGVWGAYCLNTSGERYSSTTSYEGIGYHAGTAELLRGFLASTAKIVVHRLGKSPTIIKESSKKNS